MREKIKYGLELVLALLELGIAIIKLVKVIVDKWEHINPNLW